MSVDAGPGAATADIGVVMALGLEARPLVRRLERVRSYRGGPFTFRGGQLLGQRVVIAESGPGATLARRATQALIDAHRPRWVLSAGFAGSISPAVRLGDIIVAEQLESTTNSTPVRIDVSMPANPAAGLFVGGLLTVDTVIAQVEEKRRLAQAYPRALAVEMESYGVAALCRDQGQRLLAIRVVTDDLSADLPAEIQRVMAAGEGPRGWGAAAKAIWNRPAVVSDLWTLRERSMKAGETLAGFLAGVIAQLAPQK